MAQISISDHFTYKKIFRFTISPILQMIFISLYGIVDGYFISNYAGQNEYAGVNLIMPVVMIIGGIGFMFGSGGSALVGKLLGEQNKERANQVFTMIMATTLVTGIIFSFLAFFLIEPIAKALGSINGSASDEMVKQAIIYGRIFSLGQVFFMTQNVFQNFMIVNEKPRLSFFFTVAAGVTNMVLDFLFIAVFHWSVTGAAIATIAGMVVGSVLPLLCFIFQKKGNISFVWTKFEIRPVLRCCFNGASEFVNNISSSIVGFVFNVQLLRYFGQNGVAAYGTLMYVSFAFVATYVGYIVGMAPVISYHFGAKNKQELKNILIKSFVILAGLAIIMVLAGEFLGPLFAKAYVGKYDDLLQLTVYAFHIYSIHFLFCGFSIFLSGFFTALNNGLVSAFISFCRTLILEIAFVLILPLIFNGNGIWWSVVAAEFIAFILSFIFLFAQEKKYGYFRPLSR